MEVRETKDYLMQVVEIDGALTYGIINKSTSVVEADGRILPMMVKLHDELQQLMDRYTERDSPSFAVEDELTRIMKDAKSDGHE